MESDGSIQILAFFDQLPVFDKQLDGRRLDITMLDTRVGQDLEVPAPDNVIVKTLLSPDRGKSVLSLFFRYQPQDLKISSGPANTLVIDLLPGNRFTQTYRKLTARLGNLESVYKNTTTRINPLTFSAYSSDWKSLFENYHGLSFIDASPHFYFPTFPLTALLQQPESSSLEDFQRFINGLDRQNWFSVLTRVQQKLKNTADGKDSKYLALTHADILYRLGNDSAACEQFALLSKKYGTEQVGLLAEYAQIIIRAQQGDIYWAHIRLLNFVKKTAAGQPLAPYVRLSLLESSLATGNYQQAERFLEKGTPLPTSEEIRKELRRADLLFATQRNQEAITAYEGYWETPEMDLQPYSLNAYCTLLYQGERFQDSTRCYQRLENILEDDQKKAAALYLSVLAGLQSGFSPAGVSSRLDDIIERFPGSETAVRAEIKRADLCLLQHQECSHNVLDIYQAIAEKSLSRQIAQEAFLKAALVNHFSGNDKDAIDLLQSLNRNFQSGNLRDESLALLIQILPESFKSLIEQGHDIEAISQAQQNRNLFINGWLAPSLLFELGLALERLTLYSEALNLFLYLKNLEEYHGDEDLYQALIRVAHARADLNLIEDFSGDYLHNYPLGKYRYEILFYLIDATLSDGQIERAAQLLPDPLPDRRDYKLLAASIHFFQNKQIEASEILLPLYNQAGLSQAHLFMLAESLFESGRTEMSKALYEKLAETGGYRETSIYRLAMISEKNNNDNESQILMNKLEKETHNRQWLQFIAQGKRFRQLISNL